MDCTFSNPVDYEGNTPSSTLTAFNFSTEHCTIYPATPSGTVVATTSASSSPSGELLASYGDFARTEIFAIAIVIFLLGVIAFLNIFKR